MVWITIQLSPFQSPVSSPVDVSLSNPVYRPAHAWSESHKMPDAVVISDENWNPLQQKFLSWQEKVLFKFFWKTFHNFVNPWMSLLGKDESSYTQLRLANMSKLVMA